MKKRTVDFVGNKQVAQEMKDMKFDRSPRNFHNQNTSGKAPSWSPYKNSQDKSKYSTPHKIHYKLSQQKSPHVKNSGTTNTSRYTYYVNNDHLTNNLDTSYDLSNPNRSNIRDRMRSNNRDKFGNYSKKYEKSYQVGSSYNAAKQHIIGQKSEASSDDIKMREMVIGEIKEDPNFQHDEHFIEEEVKAKDMKAYGTDLGQTFGTFNKQNCKIEIYELEKGDYGNKQISSQKKYKKTNTYTGGYNPQLKEKANIAELTYGPGSKYKKTHEFFIESPQKKSNVIYDDSLDYYHNNESVRRRNETEDYYDSLRKRVEVEYNYNLEKFDHTDNHYYRNPKYPYHKPNIDYEPSHSYVHDVYEREPKYIGVHLPTHLSTDESNITVDRRTKVSPARRPDPITSKIDHKGNYYPIGEKKPSFVYERNKDPRQDYTKLTDDEIEQNERFTKDQQVLEQQVKNYDRITQLKNLHEKKMEHRNLNRSAKRPSKANASNPMTNHKITESFNHSEVPIYHREILPAFKRELEKEKQQVSKTVQKKEPVSEIKNKKKVLKTENIAVRDSDVPIKKSDAKNAQHPKSKKYKEIIERYKEKTNPRNTEYQKSFIPPEEADYENDSEAMRRAKTQDNRLRRFKEERVHVNGDSFHHDPVPKSNNFIETEYRDEFWDINNNDCAFDKKGHKNIPIKNTNPNEETEYMRNFSDPRAKTSKDALNSIQRQGFGTEYREEFTNSAEHKSSSIRKYRRSANTYENEVTTYKKDYRSPAKDEIYYTKEYLKTKVTERPDMHNYKKPTKANKNTKKPENTLVPKKSENTKKIEQVKIADSTKKVPKKAEKKVPKKKKADTKKEIVYKKQPKEEKVISGLETTKNQEKELDDFDEAYIEEQQNINRARNLHESGNKNSPTKSEIYEDSKYPRKNQRNLRESIDNPLNKHGYEVWKPSEEMIKPDLKKALFNNVGMSYENSKENVGMEMSMGASDVLNKIINHEDRAQIEYRKNQKALKKEKGDRTQKRIDKRIPEKKFAGMAGLPSVNRNNFMANVFQESLPERVDQPSNTVRHEKVYYKDDENYHYQDDGFAYESDHNGKSDFEKISVSYDNKTQEFNQDESYNQIEIKDHSDNNFSAHNFKEEIYYEQEKSQISQRTPSRVTPRVVDLDTSQNLTPIRKPHSAIRERSLPIRRDHEIDISSQRSHSMRSNVDRRHKTTGLEKTARQRKEETFYYANAGLKPKKSEKKIENEIFQRDYSNGRRPFSIDELKSAAKKQNGFASKSVDVIKKEYQRTQERDAGQARNNEKLGRASHYVVSSRVDFDEKRLARNLQNVGYHVFDLRATHNPITGQGVSVSLKVHGKEGENRTDVEKQFKNYNLQFEKMPMLEFPDAHRNPVMYTY